MVWGRSGAGGGYGNRCKDQKIAACGSSYRGMRSAQELPQAAIFSAGTSDLETKPTIQRNNIPCHVSPGRTRQTDRQRRHLFLPAPTLHRDQRRILRQRLLIIADV